MGDQKTQTFSGYHCHFCVSNNMTYEVDFVFVVFVFVFKNRERKIIEELCFAHDDVVTPKRDVVLIM